MTFVLGLLIGLFVGAAIVAGFLGARAAHKLARSIGEQMRDLHW